ncbi:restriction endonuclease subunit S [Shewanella algae]|uniref:restriction endonuclease subunit S n=1 Tax=Shewanella algae TaxID=38313 RepID=UPI0034D74EE8
MSEQAVLNSKYVGYADYKDSGVEWVGQIPSDWEMWKIAHAYDVIGSGTTPTTSEEGWFGDGTPWVTTGELRESLIEQTKKMVTAEAMTKFSALRVHPAGSVVMAMYGATIGRLGILGVSATTNQACCVLTRSEQLDNNYVFHWLRAFRDDIINLSSGGGQPNINQEKVASLKVSAPAIEEQRTIAAFLDYETARIDSLIDKQQRLIELLKEKRQAVISLAVTKGLNPDAPMKDSGVEWLGQVPEHWVVAKLGYRYEVLLGKMLDAKRISGAHLGHYLRNTDVQWGKINTLGLPQMDFRPDEAARYSVNRGDLLVCEGGEIGRAAVWQHDEPCFYQKALHRLRPYNSKTDLTGYFFYILFDAATQGRFDGGAGKATIAHLPAETFRQYRFAFPPYEEQIELEEHLREITEKYDRIESQGLKQISLLQERRTALISAAVTGKIDLRGWNQPEAKQ